MEPEITYPWDVPKSSWEWPVLVITRRGFPEEVWKRPKNETVLSHVRFLVNQLSGKRNFVACFCEFPFYMRDLYFYVASTWICTQKLPADIITVEDVREARFASDMNRLDTFEKTDLLILPYTNPENFNLRYAKEPLGRIFQSRRIAKKATLVDVALGPADRKTSSGILEAAARLSDLYGESAGSAFGSETSKYVLVIPKE